MKILISETMFDSSIFNQKWYNGETYGGKVVEVDDKYSDCCKEDFDGFVFNVEKYNARKQKENNQVKVIELTNWFDNYFDRQFKQSQWQKNFKVSEDPYFKDESGQPKTYVDIEELKSQAEMVRETIKELRGG